MSLQHQPQGNDRFDLTEVGLSALDAVCRNHCDIETDWSLARYGCFICGDRLCGRCCETLVRASGNVTLCRVPSCRHAFDVRERMERGAK